MSARGRVVVVTGLSGAGKSTALHALEDLGYFCVDNLPTSLVAHAVDVCEAGGIHRVALGMDVRVGSFLDGALEALERVAGPDRWPASSDHPGRLEGASDPESVGARARTDAPAGFGTSLRTEERERDVVVLFLDASDETLLRRFSETRRPHPLSAGREGVSLPGHGRGALAVLDGVHVERERLAPLRARADIAIDTTTLSVHELRRRIVASLGSGTSAQPRMVTRFVSFGYKYGIPVDADVLIDVRFLENPYFVPELRDLPGTDSRVRDFVAQNPEAVELVARTEGLLGYCLPRYEREGKSYLTVGFGCTGGRHRSVAIAILVSEALREKTGLPITVVHRDLARADIISRSDAGDAGPREDGARRPGDGARTGEGTHVDEGGADFREARPAGRGEASREAPPGTGKVV